MILHWWWWNYSDDRSEKHGRDKVKSKVKNVIMFVVVGQKKSGGIGTRVLMRRGRPVVESLRSAAILFARGWFTRRTNLHAQLSKRGISREIGL